MRRSSGRKTSQQITHKSLDKTQFMKSSQVKNLIHCHSICHFILEKDLGKKTKKNKLNESGRQKLGKIPGSKRGKVHGSNSRGKIPGS